MEHFLSFFITLCTVVMIAGVCVVFRSFIMTIIRFGREKPASIAIAGSRPLPPMVESPELADAVSGMRSIFVSDNREPDIIEAPRGWDNTEPLSGLRGFTRPKLD